MSYLATLRREDAVCKKRVNADASFGVFCCDDVAERLSTNPLSKTKKCCDFL
jgi:hypothetical protein